MADTRGLAVNRDIYNFETMMYRVYDNIPAKHKHTLSALALQSTLDMRHYSNLGCKMEHYRRLNKIRYRQQLSISNVI